MIIVFIALLLLIPILTLVGINWAIKDYTEEEKQQVWENFYKWFNNFKE